MRESMRHQKYDLEDRFIDFAVAVIAVVESLPTTPAIRHVAGQLLRSGTAAAPNYGEAQAAESRKDFVHKMKIALKEMQETRVWLRVLERIATVDGSIDFDNVLRECRELIRILAKSISTAKANSRA